MGIADFTFWRTKRISERSSLHDILFEAVDIVLQRYGRPTVAELPLDV